MNIKFKKILEEDKGFEDFVREAAYLQAVESNDSHLLAYFYTHYQAGLSPGEFVAILQMFNHLTRGDE